MKKKYLKYILLFPALFILSGCSSSSPVREDQLTSYDLVIPGLTREYRFLFLTDTHCIVPDEQETKQIRDYAAERLAVFDSEKPGGGASVPALEDWSDYADRQSYDGLLLGGDIIDFPSSANLSRLDACLQKLSVPYLYTPGNHDWTYPWEYMTETGRQTFLPLLAPYMDGNTAIHALEYDDLILVAVDNSSNQISPNALEKYEELLSKGKPVVVLLHVPLYTQSLLDRTKEVWNSGVVLGGGIHGGIYPDQYSTQFLNLTLAADSPVEAILSGHVHLKESSLVTGEKNIVQITGDAGFKGEAAVIRLSGS